MSIEQVQVRIVGDHPHTGRVGTIEVIDGKVTTVNGWPFDVPMILVTLDRFEECLCAARNMRPVAPMPDHHARREGEEQP